MLLMHSSFISNASIGANPRIGLKDAFDMSEQCRRSFVKVAFPYLDIDDSPSVQEDYDRYFDELDEIEKSINDGKTSVS